jgi:putative aminopeptidase FrvX
VVSMPCRYLHSMVTMLSLNDFDKMVQLMQATLRDLTPDAADVN